MSGGLFALGLGAGLLSLTEPLFRPIAAAAFVLGAAFAGVLVWRNRHSGRLSISPHAHRNEARGPRRPK
jgi:hypothetical protein